MNVSFNGNYLIRTDSKTQVDALLKAAPGIMSTDTYGWFSGSDKSDFHYMSNSGTKEDWGQLKKIVSDSNLDYKSKNRLSKAVDQVFINTAMVIDGRESACGLVKTGLNLLV